MQLNSSVYKVVEILPTKAEFFKHLEVGDKVKFSMPLKGQGYSSNGLYATHIYLTCPNKPGLKGSVSANNLNNRLRRITLVEDIL